MKEIKLRAWCEEKKILLKVDVINFELKFMIDFNVPSFTFKFADVVFEPYTGFKDKNKNEIYDGDVVKMDGLNYLIKWDEDDGKWCMSVERDWMDYLLLTKKKLPYIEVIGNIHENKGLLNELV